MNTLRLVLACLAGWQVGCASPAATAPPSAGAEEQATGLEQQTRELIRQERYAEAQPLLEQLVQLRTRQGDSERIARAHQALAHNRFEVGYGHLLNHRFDAALESFGQALAAYRDLGRREDQALTLKLLSVTHGALGQLPQAADCETQSVEIAGELGREADEAAGLRDLGNVHYAAGQYARALEYYERSLAIFSVQGEPTWEAAALRRVGNAQWALGRRDAALRSLNRSLRISRELRDALREADALNGIGNVRHALGQYAQALANYRKSLEIFREWGDRDREANVRINIALTYLRQRQHGKAVRWLEDTFPIAGEVGEPETLWRLQASLADALAAVGRRPEAVLFYKLAIDTMRTMRAHAVVELERRIQHSLIESDDATYTRLAGLLKAAGREAEARAIAALPVIAREVADGMCGANPPAAAAGAVRPTYTQAEQAWVGRYRAIGSGPGAASLEAFRALFEELRAALGKGA